ncbi:MAG: transposase [Acidobacteria bacterium]|nr:transposase [Acidobacteriota bacterium]
MHRRPPRLSGFSYVGAHAYFLTACTYRRHPAFHDADASACARDQLLHLSQAGGFAVPAYCLMPDHAHVLLEARSASADARRFMARWRQQIGFWWRRRHASPLWQEGYWDWVLREDEDLLGVAGVHRPEPCAGRDSGARPGLSVAGLERVFP